MARHVCRELNRGDGERGYGDRDYEERGEEGVIWNGGGNQMKWRVEEM